MPTCCGPPASSSPWAPAPPSARRRLRLMLRLQYDASCFSLCCCVRLYTAVLPPPPSYGIAPPKRSRLPGRPSGGNRMKRIVQTAAVSLLAAVASVLAQAPGVQRTVVHKADVSVPGREAVIARVELAPGASAGRHTHPGDEISYVIDGEAEIIVQGQPTRKVKAGDG